jgi:hypothetical protein
MKTGGNVAAMHELEEVGAAKSAASRVPLAFP